jgi:hypothetical protein
LIRKLEPHRPASLFLTYGGAVKGISAGRHILNADRNDVTAAELAVDREVEKSQIAFAILRLQPGPDGPNLAGP